jgi:hypothetical protein
MPITASPRVSSRTSGSRPNASDPALLPIRSAPVVYLTKALSTRVGHSQQVRTAPMEGLLAHSKRGIRH